MSNCPCCKIEKNYINSLVYGQSTCSIEEEDLSFDSYCEKHKNVVSSYIVEVMNLVKKEEDERIV